VIGEPDHGDRLASAPLDLRCQGALSAHGLHRAGPAEDVDRTPLGRVLLQPVDGVSYVHLVVMVVA
jgi:hypothetical protein